MTYFCPMHFDARSSSHGKCPICGMELVAADEGHFALHLGMVAVVVLALVAGAVMLLH